MQGMLKPMTLALMSNREANYLPLQWGWDGTGKDRDSLSSLDKSLEVILTPHWFELSLPAFLTASQHSNSKSGHFKQGFSTANIYEE